MANKKRNGAQLAMPSAESRTTSLGTLDIPIDRIIVRKGWNVRQHFDPKEIAWLADSIGRIGQLDAIVVFDATAEERAEYMPDVPEAENVYTLGQGEQRLRAMRLRESRTIRGTIFARGHEESINVEGNTGRRDLEIWERCDAIAKAHAAGVPRAELAVRFKMSPQLVSIYANLRKKLLPEIWEKLIKHPGATTKIAMEIYNMPPEEQRAKWAEWLRVKDEAPVAGKPKRRKKSAKDDGPKRPPAAEIAAAESGAVEAQSIAKGVGDTSWLAGFLYGLRSTVGAPIPRGEGMPREIASLITKAAKAAKAAEVREAAE